MKQALEWYGGWLCFSDIMFVSAWCVPLVCEKKQNITVMVLCPCCLAWNALFISIQTKKNVIGCWNFVKMFYALKLISIFVQKKNNNNTLYMSIGPSIYIYVYWSISLPFSYLLQCFGAVGIHKTRLFFCCVLGPDCFCVFDWFISHSHFRIIYPFVVASLLSLFLCMSNWFDGSIYSGMNEYVMVLSCIRLNTKVPLARPLPYNAIHDVSPFLLS